MRAVVEKARSAGAAAFAFGDLYLADIRAYRERQLAGTGMEPLFPVWTTADDTPALARAMIAGARETGVRRLPCSLIVRRSCGARAAAAPPTT